MTKLFVLLVAFSNGVIIYEPVAEYLCRKVATEIRDGSRVSMSFRDGTSLSIEMAQCLVVEWDGDEKAPSS